VLYNSSQTLPNGDFVNRTQGWVALFVLGFALGTPSFVHARSTKHPDTPAQVQKSSKQYNKQLKKDAKRQTKLAKKQAKQNQKLHPNAQHQTVKRTVT